MRKTVVVGMGNTIRGDDGIGIYAVRILKERFAGREIPVVFHEMEEANINLLERLMGYDKAIIARTWCFIIYLELY